MSKVLPVVINAPGSSGLNTEQQYQLLGPEWLTLARNAILTYDGRVGPRKGWVSMTDVATEQNIEVTITLDALESSQIIGVDQTHGTFPTFTVGEEEITAIYQFGSSGTGQVGTLWVECTGPITEATGLRIETDDGIQEFLFEDADSVVEGPPYTYKFNNVSVWAETDDGLTYVVEAIVPVIPEQVYVVHEYIR